MYHLYFLLFFGRLGSSAILTRGNKAVLSVSLDANLGGSLKSLWIWDSGRVCQFSLEIESLFLIFPLK
ncbi:unnamed protein product [Rhizophagus irregularis]|nr:unnamed protein product [Rhizophagus irregularis]